MVVCITMFMAILLLFSAKYITVISRKGGNDKISSSFNKMSDYIVQITIILGLNFFFSFLCSFTFPVQGDFHDDLFFPCCYFCSSLSIHTHTLLLLSPIPTELSCWFINLVLSDDVNLSHYNTTFMIQFSSLLE